MPRGPSKITAFHRPEHVIIANLPDESLHLLFMVRITGGVDPTISVEFAYVPFEGGLTLRAISRTPESESETYNWLDPRVANQTSRRPKYNHHASGRAHFSQTGRIQSIGRNACPLRQINGQAFTVILNTPEAFPLLRDRDERRARQGTRSLVPLTVPFENPEWLTIVGCVYEKQVYEGMLEANGIWCEVDDNFTRKHYPDGRIEKVALLTEPTERLSQPTSLLVELRLVERDLGEHVAPVFMFLGGFDSPDPALVRDEPGFLAIRFPAAPEDQDLSLIESLDIPS